PYTTLFRSVDDNECFCAICLLVYNASEQYARRADEGTSGIEEKLDPKAPQRARNRLRIVIDALSEVLRRRLIINSQSPSGVDIFDAVASSAKLSHDIGNPLHGRRERREIHYLRTDVNAHPSCAQVFQL